MPYVITGKYIEHFMKYKNSYSNHALLFDTEEDAYNFYLKLYCKAIGEDKAFEWFSDWIENDTDYPVEKTKSLFYNNQYHSKIWLEFFESKYDHLMCDCDDFYIAPIVSKYDLDINYNIHF